MIYDGRIAALLVMSFIGHGIKLGRNFVDIGHPNTTTVLLIRAISLLAVSSFYHFSTIATFGCGSGPTYISCFLNCIGDTFVRCLHNSN